MRYRSRTDVQHAVAEAGLDDLTIHADGFFSQNPQLSDLDLLSASEKLVVFTSHAGCQAASIAPFLTRIADSWFVEAHRPAASRKQIPASEKADSFLCSVILC